MEIDLVLLGLIKQHKSISGYELNSNLRDSNQYFLSVSLAYIYPTLKKLHQRGWVTFTTIPITNRPDKKLYQITPEGEKVLNEWLKVPIESDMYFSAFLLKMQFAPLMENATIIDHIDREITRLKAKISDLGQLPNCVNSGKVDKPTADVLMGISHLLTDTNDLRIKWLNEWRNRVEKE